MNNEKKLRLITQIINDHEPEKESPRVMFTAGTGWFISYGEKDQKLPKLIPLMRKATEDGWDEDEMRTAIHQLRALLKRFEREYRKYCDGQSCP